MNVIFKRYIYLAIAFSTFVTKVLVYPLNYSHSNEGGDNGFLRSTADIMQVSAGDESMHQELSEEPVKNAPVNSPRIVISPTFYNFGDISVSKGVVSTTVNVKNNGKTDLIIHKIDTSCGCTTASLIIDGVEGPKFGMGISLKGWLVTLKPEETAKLKIYYDPNVHRSYRGLVLRTVTIFSNDPVDSQKQIRIKLNKIE